MKIKSNFIDNISTIYIIFIAHSSIIKFLYSYGNINYISITFNRWKRECQIIKYIRNVIFILLNTTVYVKILWFFKKVEYITVSPYIRNRGLYYCFSVHKTTDK